MRNRRLNIPLPPLRPVGERHLSPFYRPPVVKPQETIAERRTRQGWPDWFQQSKQILAVMKRAYRNAKRQGHSHRQAHFLSVDAALDFVNTR